uniref:Uncharacterized protein n=1 Tax=Knipowitschia caucasica TaxID=637954 RepID=A0AAV2LFT5_KNICA
MSGRCAVKTLAEFGFGTTRNTSRITLDSEDHAFISGGNEEIYLYNIKDKKLTGILQFPTSVNYFVQSEDKQHLYVACASAVYGIKLHHEPIRSSPNESPADIKITSDNLITDACAPCRCVSRDFESFTAWRSRCCLSEHLSSWKQSQEPQRRGSDNTGSDLLSINLTDTPTRERGKRMNTPVSLNVCRIIALTKPASKTTGDFELLCLSDKGHLQSITLPLVQQDGECSRQPPTQGGRSVKDLLSAIGDVCERASNLNISIKSKNQILRRLNQVANVCLLLWSDSEQQDHPIRGVSGHVWEHANDTAVLHAEGPNRQLVKVMVKEVEVGVGQDSMAAVEVQVESLCLGAVCGLHHAILERVQTLVKRAPSTSSAVSAETLGLRAALQRAEHSLRLVQDSVCRAVSVGVSSGQMTSSLVKVYEDLRKHPLVIL